jgi:2-polyprenyl-3-methyl-5-hydroxy-6-metoxy-1,4-benzoquinol methylase
MEMETENKKTETPHYSDIDIAGRILMGAYHLTHSPELTKQAKRFTKEQILKNFRGTRINIEDAERVFDELRLAFTRYSLYDKEIEFSF